MPHTTVTVDSQFLTDVEWGTLDYLIVDTPPGTSDEHISLVQYLSLALNPQDGALIVSTPQEERKQPVSGRAWTCLFTATANNTSVHSAVEYALQDARLTCSPMIAAGKPDGRAQGAVFLQEGQQYARKTHSRRAVGRCAKRGRHCREVFSGGHSIKKVDSGKSFAAVAPVVVRTAGVAWVVCMTLVGWGGNCSGRGGAPSYFGARPCELDESGDTRQRWVLRARCYRCITVDLLHLICAD